MKLYEKYRPRSWSEVIGQDKAVKVIDHLRSRNGLAGQSYYLSSASGVGKTSIARLIACEVADDWDTIEYADPSYLTADEIRRIDSTMHFRPMGRGTCVIVNEIHLANSSQVGKLLGLTENCPAWFTWIFTTTKDGEGKLFEMDDSSPFLSRSVEIPITSQGVCKPFAERCLAIARAEGLDGQPIEKYERLLKDCKNNMRAALQKIEAGFMLK